jgi:signal transduction histidine kinase
VPYALIASCHAGVAESLTALLCARYETRVVTDGELALREAQELSPEVVVLHDHLGGSVNATEVAARLVLRPELRTSWIVGFGSPSSAGAFYKAGLDAFEPEPLDVEAFTARLAAALHRRQVVADLSARVERLERRGTELLEAERAKDDMTHMLVHDLKNPITAVIGLIDIVLKDGRTLIGPDLYNLLEVAREESQHLLSLAANILDVRRMQEGKLVLNRRALDSEALVRVLEQALSDVGTVAKERRVTLVAPEDLPAFPVDQEMLRRILANLVSNAVKHTRRGGRIEILAKLDDDQVELVVRDDGEGIPPEDLERIFRAYERSGATASERFDTGMGLSFCKLAVERHGGRIWAESQWGKGASFFFTFPMAVVEPPGELVGQSGA